jgi:ATP-dependent exoDNAse (exonuclease V) beta subunit
LAQAVIFVSFKMDQKRFPGVCRVRYYGIAPDRAIIHVFIGEETIHASLSLAQVGTLLKDWRRVNVAMTRAKSKLVIVGSRRTLAAASLMREFVALVTRNGWVYKLPTAAGMSRAADGTVAEVRVAHICACLAAHYTVLLCDSG